MSSYVYTPVPEHRLAEVMALLYGTAEAKPEAHETSPERTPDETARLLRRVYLDSEPTFRRLLLLLANRPDPTAPMLHRDVSEAMGWPTTRSLPGALGAYGRRANHRYGGFWPFKRGWNHHENSNTLSMKPEAAEQLLELHAEHDLPTT